MNRRSNSTIGIVGVCCVTFWALAAAQSFGAVTNSFFDSDSQLSGWQTGGTGEVAWSPISLTIDGTGSASLQESAIFPSSSILWQTFSVEPGRETLTFSVRTPLYGEGETDTLLIDLFDPDNNQISLFDWNTGSGEYLPPEPYFTSTDLGNGWQYDFTVAVASWINNDITLRFQLDNEDETLSEPEGIHTSILVDNVVLHGTTPVVPIPGAMGLALSGLAAMGVFARKLA